MTPCDMTSRFGLIYAIKRKKLIHQILYGNFDLAGIRLLMKYGLQFSLSHKLSYYAALLIMSVRLTI